MQSYTENYARWLAADALSAEEKAELRALADNEAEIRERFSCYLSFGTAGLRGHMKTGMNAMNRHTVAYATQGMATLIRECGRQNEGVVIAYDSRNNSQLFAETAASVLAANGIPVYLFDGVRPTPELSFALRELHCVAGINVTASHNPKAYNGYKAYWDDGAQLPPEHAAKVAETMAKLDIFSDIQTTDFTAAVADGRIRMIGAELDEAYLKVVQAQAVNPSAVTAVADRLKIVYTPLHGAGYKLVPEILGRCGVKHLFVVPEQGTPDGNFPTVEKPNPEYKEVFELGIAIANREGADMVLATDPDADRTGVVTRTKNGEFQPISGNQMGALLLDYILNAYEETGTMPADPYAVKSIVSTELINNICEAHGVTLHNVLTGFKFIGEVIKQQEAKGEGSFVFGFEESYGYLKGTYARDKDAVVTSMLICEMTAYYTAKGMTLADALDSLYERYGYSYEANQELYMEGLDGVEKMKALMDSLRKNPPAYVGGQAMASIADYLTGEITDCVTGTVTPTGLTTSNVLRFVLRNGDVIAIRPSGTEPKIKLYYLLRGKNRAACESNLASYLALMNSRTKI